MTPSDAAPALAEPLRIRATRQVKADLSVQVVRTAILHLRLHDLTVNATPVDVVYENLRMYHENKETLLYTEVAFNLQNLEDEAEHIAKVSALVDAFKS